MNNDFKNTEILLQEIAKSLDTILSGMGFTLLVFPFNNPGISNYVSNSNRSDMIKVLRETANRLEKNQDIPKTKGEA